MNKIFDWAAQAYQLVVRAAWHIGGETEESEDLLKKDLWKHADDFVDNHCSVGDDNLYIIVYNMYDVCGTFILNRPINKPYLQKQFLVKKLKKQFFKNDVIQDVEWYYQEVETGDKDFNQIQLDKKTHWQKPVCNLNNKREYVKQKDY